ncbi:MAG: SusC/RagA family TonB-linked outer membrane protein [Mucilaginibacter sp.]
MYKPLPIKRKKRLLILSIALWCCFNLAFTSSTAASQDLTKKISLDLEKKTLKEAFDQIANKAKIAIIYSDINDVTKKEVTIHVKEKAVSQVLDDLLPSYKLSYQVIDDKIVITQTGKPNPTKDSNRQSPANPIKGTVTDPSGGALLGATVKLKESSTIVITDQNGDFEISPLKPTGILIISFVGYQTTEVPFNNSTSERLIIILKADANSLNEVQVIGYGTTTKRLNTGSVSTINAKEIENQPVTNPLAALQGRAPGVFVQTQNGLPGGNVTIQIRGQGSLSSGTNPLYVIDGVPFLSSPLATNANALGANGVISPFSIVNPGDIESVSILKDADATAIYGSRGANGVVLITTKKGAIGKDNFTIEFNQGINRISRLNKYLNLPEYLQLRKDAFKNDNVTPDSQSAPDLLVWSQTQSTDWQKYFYGNTANVTNLQSSLTGGDLQTHYLASFNFHKEGTIIPGDASYLKGGGYINIDHQSIDKKFYTTFSVGYNRDDNQTFGQSIINTLGSLPPNFPIYNADGSFNWTTGTNPVANLQQRQNSQTAYFNANSVIKYIFFQGFDAKVNLGYNSYTIKEIATLPASSQYPGASDVAYFANGNSGRYIIEPQLDYIKHFKDGTLTALIGGTYQYSLNTGETITGTGVNNPDLLGNLGSATTILAKANTYTQYKYGSVFGRINYNWMEKYLLDVNLRRDGSSRFGPGRQFGNFYAVGAGWIFSQENFVKDNLAFLSYGKIRGSYGLTGNDQISDYQYLYTYANGATYDGAASLSPSKLANQNYSWETTKKLELATELGFLHDRILTTIALYKNTSGNQLIAYTVPYITGFNSYQANFPAVIQNTGLEFELNVQAIKGKIFTWNTSFNISFQKNELKSFPGLASSSYANTYVVGKDLSSELYYQFLGVNPQTGLPIYKDQNGDGQITYPEDAIVVGHTSPNFFGGFNNTFNYKGFQVDVFLEFVKRSYDAYLPQYGSTATNEPEYLVNRWEKPGDVTNIPRATLDPDVIGNLYLSSSRFSDASYIRLKNLSLAYSLKSSLVQKWKLKDVKIFVQGQNLLVFTNKLRFDPELSSSNVGIPPLKTLIAGLKLSL